MTHSFSPLQLGPLTIEFPVIQAALSGYSDWPMRVMAKRLGAPFTICEVMLDKFILDVTKGSKAKRFLRVSDEEHPCAAQLMGAVPEQFSPAAIKLVEAGFDAIDLNFACPVKKVLGRCRGGFLLSRPEIALEIVARVREALPEKVPLTVKMRRGMDDSAQSLDNFYEIFDGAYRLGAAAITVHGRTVRQRYEGDSSWQFLGDIKRRAGNHVLIGSGDLFTARDCLNMFEQTGVNGVAVARGAIGNPWIFQQIKELASGREMPPPGLLQQREVIAEHYRLAGEIYGERRCCALMRKFGIKYSRLHPHASQVREAFIAVKEPDDWRMVLKKWYADDLPGIWPESVDKDYYSQNK
jgi:tRNA-dihydrouridine synthase B